MPVKSLVVLIIISVFARSYWTLYGEDGWSRTEQKRQTTMLQLHETDASTR